MWDEASGYYYDAASGYYYDGNSGLHSLIRLYMFEFVMWLQSIMIDFDKKSDFQ